MLCDVVGMIGDDHHGTFPMRVATSVISHGECEETSTTLVHRVRINTFRSITLEFSGLLAQVSLAISNS